MPVVQTPALQTMEVRIASRVRQLRIDQGLTLADLAARAAMSQALLSRIENHKVSLTIDGLERLAHALAIPMTCFFEEDQTTAPIVVCRAGQGTKSIIRGQRGFRAETLASAKKGKLMEPILVDVASAKQEMPLKSHPGEEFNFVLEGECNFVYAKEQVHLLKGDSVYYDASVPHAARAVPGKPCRMVVVVASRDYLFHGDLSKLLNGEPGG